MRRRVQKSEAPQAPTAPAIPSLAERFSKMAGPVPGVLTVEAVEAQYMPEVGHSALPLSLEGDVPAEFRYWMVQDAAQAREIRDALVEKAIFTHASIVEVDGALRRVVTKRFLVEEDPPGPDTKYAMQEPASLHVASFLTKTAEDVLVYDTDTSPKLDTISKAFAEPAPWLAVYQDEPVSRAALLAASPKSLFKARTRPGLLFASNVELDPAAQALVAQMAPMEKHAVRLYKKKSAPVEERIVYGVVLEPDTEDSQTDVYSADEIRKTAHGFMEGYRSGNYLAHQHDGKDITGQLLVLESFIAPVDFEVEGLDGTVEKVKKGTWLMATRILDDGLWEDVKKGLVTGYSIGGDAIRRAEPRAAAA